MLLDKDAGYLGHRQVSPLLFIYLDRASETAGKL